MEGVSAEAASLAGHLGLANLCWIYDNNRITIEGHTGLACSEDVATRFMAYGWNVTRVGDANDGEMLQRAFETFRNTSDRPTLIIVDSHIAYGAPHKQDTSAAHGEPLGEEAVKLTKQELGWPYEEPFTLPDDALGHFRQAVDRGREQQQQWKILLDTYREAHPAEAKQLDMDLSGDLPAGWDSVLKGLFDGAEKPVSTRDAGNTVMNAIAITVHVLTGGSADLAPSNKTLLTTHGDFGFEDEIDHNMHFGIREHAMGSIANGMAAHGGPIPYTATFLIFSDYMRPPIRLAALMGLRVVFIFTHDSIGVGEDGPTHQPIEQLAALRAVPNLAVIRPADATETAEAWKAALERRDGPTVLALSRQNLPVLDRNALASADGVQRGGYVVWEASPQAEVILIGTGSELHIALDAGKLLQESGISARVVSLPSWELFEAQSAEYRNQVLPPGVTARVSVEAGVTMGWERYVGALGTAVGLSGFGASGKGPDVYKHFGLTPDRVAEEAKRVLHRK